MRKRVITNLHSRHVPRKIGRLYFRTFGGHLHPIEDPERDCGTLKAVEKTDGPLTPFEFVIGEPGYSGLELAHWVGLVGIFIYQRGPTGEDPPPKSRYPEVEFFRGAS